MSEPTPRVDTINLFALNFLIENRYQARDWFEDTAKAADQLLKLARQLERELSETTKLNKELTEQLTESNEKTKQLEFELQAFNNRPSFPISENPSPTPPLQNQLLDLPAITKIIKETIVAEKASQERSCVAVIEKMPELLNDHQTGVADQNFVQAIAKEIGVEHDLRLRKLHRQGQRKEGRNRHIKVYFNTKESRDTFIYTFRKCLPKLQENYIRFNLNVRRDMAADELARLRELRKEAYEKNKALGLLKFYVSDLILKEVSNPRPFVARP